MPITATPSLEAVLAAIRSEIESLASIGLVRTSDKTVEDDVEALDQLTLLDADEMNFWLVELLSSNELEGDAVGEKYVLHAIRIRYWSIRTDNPDWSKEARIKAASVQELLSGNAAVFRIGGQIPLRIPETVSLDSHGIRTITGEDGPQMVYQTTLGLTVEARRWG